MSRKPIVAAILVLIASLALSACGAPQGGGGGGGGGESKEDFRTKLQLGTGSVGGVYFPLGQQLANLWEKNIGVQGFKVNAVETGASVENLAKISRGQLQLGLAQNNTGQQAVKGTGEFKGTPIKNAGFMGQLYPEAVQIITLKRTGIESVEDLEGKKVAVGPPGGATRAAANLVLNAHGIENYQAIEEGFDTAKAKLQDGNIAASIEVLGVPASSVEELQAATGGVRLVPIDEKAVQKIEQQSGYQAFEIPKDAYDFMDEPVPTISAFACLFGSTNQVSEDLGYKLTKTLYEKADQITLPQSKFITPENALTGRGNLPLHPGAEKYFREKGILKQ